MFIYNRYSLVYFQISFKVWDGLHSFKHIGMGKISGKCMFIFLQFLLLPDGQLHVNPVTIKMKQPTVWGMNEHILILKGFSVSYNYTLSPVY